MILLSSLKKFRKQTVWSFFSHSFFDQKTQIISILIAMSTKNVYQCQTNLSLCPRKHTLPKESGKYGRGISPRNDPSAPYQYKLEIIFQKFADVKILLRATQFQQQAILMDNTAVIWYDSQVKTQQFDRMDRTQVLTTTARLYRSVTSPLGGAMFNSHKRGSNQNYSLTPAS